VGEGKDEKGEEMHLRSSASYFSLSIAIEAVFVWEEKLLGGLHSGLSTCLQHIYSKTQLPKAPDFNRMYDTDDHVRGNLISQQIDVSSLRCLSLPRISSLSRGLCSPPPHKYEVYTRKATQNEIQLVLFETSAKLDPF
jgi:hypothetical protein